MSHINPYCRLALYRDIQNRVMFSGVRERVHWEQIVMTFGTHTVFLQNSFKDDFMS